jgi:hypothetical protein
MVQGRRIAATFTFVCLAALLGAGGGAVALTLPSTTTVTVPTITTPTVTTPAVPVVTTPTVTTPKVSTPTVTTPKVTTPKVAAPTVTTPKLTVPGSGSNSPAGGSPTSGVQNLTGKVVGGGGGGGGTSGGLPSAGSGPLASGVVGTTGTAGGQSGPAGSNGAVPPYGDGGGPYGGGPGATGGPGGPGAIVGGPGTGTSLLMMAGAGTMQLRNALAPLIGCFYAITPFQQEVLVMRAGLDGSAPISRINLASALGMTTGDVARSERTAIRQMRGAAREDGCMAASTSSGLFPLATAFIGGPFGPVGFVDPATGAVARPPAAVAVTEGGGAPSGSVQNRSFADRLAGLRGESGQAGPVWLILLTTIALCLALGALLREARRSV